MSPTTLELPLCDTVCWPKVRLRTADVGQRRDSGHRFGGRTYRTGSERNLAELLTASGVEFVPNVRFELSLSDGSTREHVPDFVFERQTYVWHGSKGNKPPLLIHGIEAKARDKRTGKFPDKAWENMNLLLERHGLRILLLSNQAIARHYRQFNENGMPLPLIPYDGPANTSPRR